MKRLLVAAVLVISTIAAAVISSRDDRRIAAARAMLDDGMLRAVVLGDSVARGAGDEQGRGIPGMLDELLQTRGIRAAATASLGINGARTRDVTRLLAKSAVRSTIRTADVIVLSIGGNDLYGDSIARLLATCCAGHRQARTVARVQHVVASIRKTNPAARIYVLGLYNPYRRSRAGEWLDQQVNLWDARLIERFATDRGVTVIRICDLLQRNERISALDRFHPSAAGYAAIASRIASSF